MFPARGKNSNKFTYKKNPPTTFYPPKNNISHLKKFTLKFFFHPLLTPLPGDAIHYFLSGHTSTDAQNRLFNWHIANLEYGCATELTRVSLHHWDQDDKYEWAGAHCMLPEGFQSITSQLSRDLNINFDTSVQSVEYNEKGVKVSTSKGVFEADMTVVTLPLGVLKEG